MDQVRPDNYRDWWAHYQSTAKVVLFFVYTMERGLPGGVSIMDQVRPDNYRDWWAHYQSTAKVVLFLCCECVRLHPFQQETR